MAEINKIKVGETTYDINTKYLYNTGGYTCLGDGSGPIVIGTNAPYGDKKERKAIIFGSFVEIYDKSGKLVNLGSLSSGASNTPGLILQDNHLILGSKIALGSASDFDVWIGTDGVSPTYLCAGGIMLRGGSDISLGSVVGFQYVDNGTLIIGTGVSGSSHSIAIGAPQKPVEITIGSMYNNHCGIQLTPSEANGDSISMVCGNSLIEFYSGGIGIHKSGMGLNIGTGGKGYVNMDNKVSIGGFLFEADQSASKLTISYNGKKAEIQLN